MKSNNVILFLLLHTTIGFGQDEQPLEVLKTDNTWIKEIIEFPLGFAQEITFEGFEDLRFPPGWSNEDSPNFWSYAWAWSLNDIEGLSANELEHNIQLYFDGLLGMNSLRAKNKNIEHTNAVFIKKEMANGSSQYIGKVKTFDSRYTKKTMVLRVLVEQYYCPKKNRSIILFRFSPKAFGHDVWRVLEKVELRADACEY